MYAIHQKEEVVLWAVAKYEVDIPTYGPQERLPSQQGAPRTRRQASIPKYRSRPWLAERQPPFRIPKPKKYWVETCQADTAVSCECAGQVQSGTTSTVDGEDDIRIPA